MAVSIICASPPLLKPTPIRPVCRRAIEAQAEKIEVTPLQPRRAGPTERRPSMLRATTLDGRSLEEVIQAAHRASRYDQVTVKTPSTPQYQSTSYTYQSRPHLRTERRESWHSNSTDHSYHPNPHQRSRPSSMDDVQAYDYPYQYPSRHDYSLTSHPY
ncbi:uncharacterized protein MELLADRAFT_70796 [Melampsora larici-populina 98AG31]|uniref:Uncharacterized protein n=1 Tax=Melampsora larici-populina (strain 98AG31 / pathotype 3-4-7) TaxID=747676 RepID=F4R7Z1_MELLP|nr:uncharacterized protein MELLADRAFT_70796 [Melampsora larici-populina 98AG31]EGG11401.1 hypothetical protein MELLADRAFT_70796 [Melampsora larici-populina 98AG31]